MHLLILGGTLFIGRHIVEAALAAGHAVTIFNRGRTNPDLFAGVVERLYGDRDSNLAALSGRWWDAVVDVNGYVPRHVEASATLLSDTVERYIYVSTGAVYATPFSRNGDERAPLKPIPDEASEDTDTYYGELKLLCERRAEQAVRGRTLVLRLGLATGPHDDTDRATYWVTRLARGGRVLAPGSPNDALQLIDARDFAHFVVRSTEARLTGIYNATGRSLPWRDWFEAFQRAGSSAAEIVWIDDREFLRERLPQRRYGALPLFLPEAWGEWWTNNNDRAQALGLAYRPPEETARDVLAWADSRPDDYEWQAGLSAAEERAILEQWQGRSGSGR